MENENKITFSDGNYTINVQPQLSVKEISDRFLAIEEKLRYLAHMVAHHHSCLGGETVTTVETVVHKEST
jgi:hypothetical protein